MRETHHVIIIFYSRILCKEIRIYSHATVEDDSIRFVKEKSKDTEDHGIM